MADKPQSHFTLNFFDKAPSPEALADELERIAGMVRQGYVEGEAHDGEQRGYWEAQTTGSDA